MKKETTTFTLATLTAEQKAMLSVEQFDAIKAVESTLSEKQVSNLLASMLKEAEKAKKLEIEKAIREKEKLAKKEARKAENEVKHAEKYLSFHTSNVELEIENERDDLKGMVIVTSKKFGLQVVIPSGHDNNAVVILRQTDENGAYEMVFDTKQKRSARTANLVHNNKKLVTGWIEEAVSRFSNIYELVEFLNKQVNNKGENRYNTLDLDILNEAQKAGDKTSARLAKKYGEYFTIKSIK